MANWQVPPRWHETYSLFYGFAWFNGRSHILIADRKRGPWFVGKKGNPWFVGKRPVAWNARRGWHYVNVKRDIKPEAPEAKER